MITDLGINYKYFILSMKEYFEAENYKLENRRFDSIIYLLEEYLKLDEEIKRNVSDTSKLKRSKKALLNNIVFYFENSSFKNKGEFKRDIENLLKTISKSNYESNNDNEKKESAQCDNGIFYAISALYKKISKVNILDYWIKIILNESKSFDDVDMVTDCYINELLYAGYSLKYLSEWWKDTFKDIFEETDENKLKENIEKFSSLSNYKDEIYKIILQFNLPDKIKKELNQKQEITISNIKYKLLSDEYKMNLIESNLNYKKFFESSKVTYCLIEVRGCDKYRAIEKVIYPLQQYSEIYKIIEKNISNVHITKYLIEENGYFVEKNLSEISGYLREINDREREDIEDFIVLRDKLRNEMFGNDFGENSIFDIELAINLMYSSTEITVENKLLNNWSCVENLVKSYAGNSIIDKVNKIIPKVICMYIIKRKMNILWERIYPLLSRKIYDENLEKCKLEGKDNKYDSEAFAKYLLSKEAKKLYEDIEYVTIKRELGELHKYISNPKSLSKYIDTIELSITGVCQESCRMNFSKKLY